MKGGNEMATVNVLADFGSSKAGRATELHLTLLQSKN